MKYTPQQITELAKKYHQDPTPRNSERVIIAMDGLCKFWVNRHRALIDRSRLDFDDLLQEARMGVLRALKKYDGESTFTLYAPFWIRARISSHIEKELTMVKFCTTQETRLVRTRYSAAREAVLNEDHTLTTKEMHERMAGLIGVSVKSVEVIAQSHIGIKDLDGPVSSQNNNGKTVSLGDYITDGKNWEEKLITQMDNDKALSILDSEIAAMSPKKQVVARRRILNGETLKDVGDEIGITRERVRQIEKQSKEQLIFWARRGLGIDSGGLSDG
jgi:RNA polymerase sigma factor (sigma-70 family)